MVLVFQVFLLVGAVLPPSFLVGAAALPHALEWCFRSPSSFDVCAVLSPSLREGDDAVLLLLGGADSFTCPPLVWCNSVCFSRSGHCSEH